MSASKLNAGAKEWRPPPTSSSNTDVLLANDFALPPTHSDAAATAAVITTTTPPSGWGVDRTPPLAPTGAPSDRLPPPPNQTVYVYDESTGEGELMDDRDFPTSDSDAMDRMLDEHNEDFVGRSRRRGPPYGVGSTATDSDGGGGGAAVAATSFHPSYSQQQPHQQSYAPQQSPGQMFSNGEDMDGYAAHAAQFASMPAMTDRNGMPMVPTIPGGDDVDWDAELKKFLVAQSEQIQKQLSTQRGGARGGGVGGGGITADANATPPLRPVSAEGAAVADTTPKQSPAAPPQQPSVSSEARAAAAFWAKGPAAVRGGNTGPAASSASGGDHRDSSHHHHQYTQQQQQQRYGGGGAASSSHASVAPSGAASNYSGAPLTINGKHRWPKQTKAQQRQEQAQKQAFESFANALLHSTSPFMEPLRVLCKSSLPHLKLDQRFGKRGAPHTAVSQFIVAPIVVNYRPRHFHELSPGDLLEFHYDFSQVLKKIGTANCIAFNYGPDWKPFAVPFCYLGCRDYKAEVLKLCPHEVPNSRSEAVYEDDIVKDITDLVLAIDELQPLRKWSMIQCMSKRVNLAALYEAVADIFAPIGNYQLQIRDLHRAPSTFLIKTSQQILDVLPNRGKTGIVLHDDDRLWYELPEVDNTFQSGRSRVVTTSSEEAPTGQVVGAQVPSSQPPLPPASVPTSRGVETSNVTPSSAQTSTAARGGVAALTSSSAALAQQQSAGVVATTAAVSQAATAVPVDSSSSRRPITAGTANPSPVTAAVQNDVVATDSKKGNGAAAAAARSGAGERRASPSADSAAASSSSSESVRWLLVGGICVVAVAATAFTVYRLRR